MDAFGIKNDKVEAYSSFGDCSSKYMTFSTTVSDDVTQAISYMN
jgi:uncharacterized protein YneR